MSLNTTPSAISPAIGGTPGVARPTAGGTGKAGGFEALLASLAGGDAATAGTGAGVNPGETVASTGDVAWPTTLLGVDARNQPIILNGAPEAAKTTTAAIPADAVTGSVEAAATASAPPDVAPASVSAANDTATETTQTPATAPVVTTANAGTAATPSAATAEPAPAGKADKPAPDHGAPATPAETRTRTTGTIVSTAPAEIAATPASDDTKKAVEVAMTGEAAVEETQSDGDGTPADTAAVTAQVPTPTLPPEPKASPVIAFAVPPATETPVQADPQNAGTAIDANPSQTPAIVGEPALTASGDTAATSDVAAPPADTGKTPPPGLKDYAAARDATGDDAPSSASASAMTGSAATGSSAGGRSSSLESMVASLEQAAGQNPDRKATAVGTDGGTGNATINPLGTVAGVDAARAAHATSPASAATGHTVTVNDPASLSDSVGVAISRHAAAGKTEFTLRLDPAELGRIEVKLHVAADGQVQAVVSADNASTYDLLRQDASTLERALADAGLKTDGNSLSFNLRQQDGQPNQQHAGGGQNIPGMSPRDGAEPEPLPSTSQTPTPRSATGLLDVFA